MKESIFKILKYPAKTINNRPGLVISRYAANSLNLKYDSGIILQFGSKKIRTFVTSIPNPEFEDKTIWLTEDIFDELLLPENITIRIQILGDGDIIKIGPVIGVLIDNFLIEDYKKGCHIRESFECYAEAGSKINGLVYIFSLKNVDLENERVLGFAPIFNKSMVMTWQERWLPIPDEIHNRIKISTSSPGYKKIEATKKLMPSMNIINRTTKIFKWDMQKILMKDRSISKYLPKTLLYKGTNTLTKMLQEFPFIYLKPVGRSLGLGIIKIINESDDKYTAKYRKRGKSYSIYGSLEEIIPPLQALMGKRTYIVQEGIPLATYNGNIFDLRVSMQKDETAAWSISRFKVRVAPYGSIVTNVAAGGTAVNVEKAITLSFGEKAPEIISSIKTAGLAICKAIENKVSGIGDIGLDIGVTQGGKIYLIEANLRELRLNGGDAEDADNWKSIFKKPIYYLNYLYNAQLQNARY